MEKPVIVCVDDEKSVLIGLRDELKFELGNEYSVEIADSGEEGIRLIKELLNSQIMIPVVISDQLMPGMKGDEFLTHVYKLHDKIRKILLTGQATAEAVGNAVNNARLYRYIAKPWDAKDLVMTVQQAARSYLVDQELDARIQVLSDLNAGAETLAQQIQADNVLTKTLELAMQQTKAERGIIIMLSNESNPVRGFFAQFVGQDGQNQLLINGLDAEGCMALLPSMVFEELRAKRQFLNIPRAFKDLPYRDDELIKTAKLKSIVAAPIQVKNTLTAALLLFHDSKAGYFEPIKIEYLTLMLRQTATALDNALLYESLEERVIERTKEIEAAKTIIEEKNQDILDSITYAQRIQYSLLPDKKILMDGFPESFIYYKPRDIVSGDFYWFAEQVPFIYIAAVDCTGHGVPGAFMSVLGSTQLNEIVNQLHIGDVDAILNALNDRVMAHLQASVGGTQLQDGMDIALVRVEPNTRQIQFAGANRPLWLLRNGEIIEYKPDKHPIGHSIIPDDGEIHRFKAETIVYQPGDQIYLFTDGITDQFGGDEGRKFSKKSFQEVITTYATLPAAEQKVALEKHLHEWQAERSQTDDILVIGIKL